MKGIFLALTLPAFFAVARGEAPADPVRAAVEKGLRRIEQGAANYTTQRKCFSCHHQAMAILGMTSARRHGFQVEPAKLRHQLDFTRDTFRTKLDQVAKGKGIPGGNTMAAYALFVLEAGGHPADDLTTALVEYLLVRQGADGSWPALTSRPPSEGSAFTNTALALRGLRAYGSGGRGGGDEQMRARGDRAFDKGKGWLLHSQPATTEDKAFRLRGLVYAGADPKEVEAARALLLKEQRGDGSWAQLAGMGGDAYATGSVLAALRAAGVPAGDPACRKAVHYLVTTQKEDGAWIVETRSRPVQTFFDNGDPGGKSQFISFAGTGWATLALLETLAEQ